MNLLQDTPINLLGQTSSRYLLPNADCDEKKFIRFTSPTAHKWNSLIERLEQPNDCGSPRRMSIASPGALKLDRLCSSLGESNMSEELIDKLPESVKEQASTYAMLLGLALPIPLSLTTAVRDFIEDEVVIDEPISCPSTCKTESVASRHTMSTTVERKKRRNKNKVTRFDESANKKSGRGSNLQKIGQLKEGSTVTTYVEVQRLNMEENSTSETSSVELIDYIMGSIRWSRVDNSDDIGTLSGSNVRLLSLQPLCRPIVYLIPSVAVSEPLSPSDTSSSRMSLKSRMSPFRGKSSVNSSPVHDGGVLNTEYRKVESMISISSQSTSIQLSVYNLQGVWSRDVALRTLKKIAVTQKKLREELHALLETDIPDAATCTIVLHCRPIVCAMEIGGKTTLKPSKGISFLQQAQTEVLQVSTTWQNFTLSYGAASLEDVCPKSLEVMTKHYVDIKGSKTYKSGLLLFGEAVEVSLLVTDVIGNSIHELSTEMCIYHHCVHPFEIT